MHATPEIEDTENWDRLTLVLVSRPRPGWEDTHREVSRRELERLVPHPGFDPRPSDSESRE